MRDLPIRGFLLTSGGYMGSLAAARDLGRAGIPVVLADAQPDSFSSASRYVKEFVQCPPSSPSATFMQWLLDYGKAHPGYVLYPTSDEMCWMMDSHHDALSQYYHLYQPAQGEMWNLLNKGILHEWCVRLGVDTPEQWTLGVDLSLEELLEQVQFPVLLKPETQAGIQVQRKGIAIPDAQALRAELTGDESSSLNFRETMLAHRPDVAAPMIQRYYPEALDGIYSLGGFFCPELDLFLVRGSKKVLQMPYRLGVGVCFERHPVHPQTAQQLKSLMQATGYRGAFEAEYIHLPAENRYLLIDLNTRFYGQMAFEIGRGIHTAQLSYHAAVGDWARVREVAAAMLHDDAHHDRCRLGWLLKLYVRTLRLGGKLDAQGQQRWLRWADEGNPIDLLSAADDPGPDRLYRRKHLHALLRHPRSTIRQFLGR